MRSTAEIDRDTLVAFAELQAVRQWLDRLAAERHEAFQHQEAARKAAKEKAA